MISGDDLMTSTYFDSPDFTGIDQIGHTLEHYNGAERYNIFSENEDLSSNENLIKALKQISREYGRSVSYGLKLHTDMRSPLKTHFLLELNDANKIGIFVYDQKRHLSVKQVQNAEKSLIRMSLTKGMIIANRIGLPARREAERINSDYDHPLLKIEHLSTVNKRYEMNII